MACERHLRDLEHGPDRGLKWQAQEAIDVCDFFPSVLRLPEETESDDDETPIAEAQPFVLSPYQQFIVGSLFGWYAWRVSKKTGKRRLQTRFRVAYDEEGKGNGKTPMGAGILIYKMIRSRNAQLYCAAVTKDQAKLAFADCDKMVLASPSLMKRVDRKVNNISIPSNGSFIRPISSEKRGLDGKRIKAAVVDELHEHPTEVVVVKVRAGTKGIADALIYIPTNSGFDRESICWQYHETSRQILEGTLENDAWFAFVCHLDSCEKCYAAGRLQPSDDCPDCDDWKTEGPHWLKPDPNLGRSVTWQYLREQVRDAVSLPSQRSWVRRLNFCQWMTQRSVWITPEQWGECKGSISSASLVGRECFLGIDLSDKLDLSAVVAVFPRPLERPWRKGSKDGDQVGDIEHAIDVLPNFWMPRDTLHRRSHEDNIPYLRWESEGHLMVSAGTVIDHDQIVDYIIEVLAKKYRIVGIGFDESGASAVATRLIRHFGEKMVIVVPQGFRRLNTPSKTMESLVISKNLIHDGNPVMGMCMSNMAKDENNWREIRPIKISQRQRMDGGVALIDAIFTMQQLYVPVPDLQLLVLGGSRS